ncbi:MAG: cysteine-rich small domain-containing protein [Firmicutes bacterium]|nr:cysteine-rich small domain-containing protein [Bacillota bacterium]
MKNSYKFFSNKQCEYFPCHAVKNADDFNCLFCYCPLYNCDCGGNFTIAGELKDCSNCVLPHIPKNYDIVLDLLHKQIFEK